VSPTALKRRRLARPGRKDFLRNQMISLYGRSCWLCGRAIALGAVVSVDHVRHLSEGGSNKIHNLRPAHEKCNRKRGNGPIPVLLLTEEMRLQP
jgi:5-methylcytosine-specific restriction endonuclease McrA